MYERLAINHFKSIEHADITLGRVNVLVGTNGSGKSNIVDALRFIRDALMFGLDRAVSDRHGIESIRQWSPTRPYQLGLEVSIREASLRGSYAFNIGSKKRQFEVARERAWMEEFERFEQFQDEDGTVDFLARLNEITVERDSKGFVTVKNRTATTDDDPDDPDPDVENQLRNFLVRADVVPSELKIDQVDDLSLGSRVAWQVSPLRRRLTNFQAYSIYPNTLRVPQEPSNETFLTPEGRNLATVLKRMRRTKRGLEAIAQITDSMRGLLPGLDRISILSVGGFLVPQFHMVEPSGRKHIFNVSQMSDGTLRVLGLLTALYQEPRPAVIALEEPEQTVNPGILAMVAESIKEVSHSAQVLLTTHSPELLDQFEPSDVIAVEMAGGKTQVGRVNEVQIGAVRDRLFSLGELLASEGLRR